MHLPYYDNNGQVIQEVGTNDRENVWSPVYINALVERDDTTSGGVSTRRLYAEQDGNWNTTSLTDSSGNVAERYQYDPYGSITVMDASFTPVSGNVSAYGMQYLFQGGRVDPANGLYHFEARDYDPATGRWIEQDPAGYVNGANRYQMELSDPALGLDPSGEGVLLAAAETVETGGEILIGSGETAVLATVAAGGAIGYGIGTLVAKPSIAGQMTAPLRPPTLPPATTQPATPTAPATQPSTPTSPPTTQPGSTPTGDPNSPQTGDPNTGGPDTGDPNDGDPNSGDEPPLQNTGDGTDTQSSNQQEGDGSQDQSNTGSTDEPSGQQSDPPCPAAESGEAVSGTEGSTVVNTGSTDSTKAGLSVTWTLGLTRWVPRWIKYFYNTPYVMIPDTDPSTGGGDGEFDYWPSIINPPAVSLARDPITHDLLENSAGQNYYTSTGQGHYIQRPKSTAYGAYSDNTGYGGEFVDSAGDAFVDGDEDKGTLTKLTRCKLLSVPLSPSLSIGIIRCSAPKYVSSAVPPVGAGRVWSLFWRTEPAAFCRRGCWTRRRVTRGRSAAHRSLN